MKNLTDVLGVEATKQAEGELEAAGIRKINARPPPEFKVRAEVLGILAFAKGQVIVFTRLPEAWGFRFKDSPAENVLATISESGRPTSSNGTGGGIIIYKVVEEEGLAEVVRRLKQCYGPLTPVMPPFDELVVARLPFGQWTAPGVPKPPRTGRVTRPRVLPV